MTNSSISESLKKFSARKIKSSRLVALLVVAAFTSVLPARAQTSDAWKSVAIIGGSTAAGAYIGHKVGGRTGTYVGAAVGASAGYAIDRRRRQSEYYNSDYPYANSGYNGNNGGYYGNTGYYGNNGYDASNGGYGNNSGYGNNGGYYATTGGYNGGSYPYSGNGRYYRGSRSTYRSGCQSNSHSANDQHQVRRNR